MVDGPVYQKEAVLACTSIGAVMVSLWKVASTHCSKWGEVLQNIILLQWLPNIPLFFHPGAELAPLPHFTITYSSHSALAGVP
jgi:hypothetical protein